MTKKKEFPTKDETVELYKHYFPPQPKRNNYTLQQADSDEEIFAIRAQDESAPMIVMEWIKENFFSASEDKLRSAFESALRLHKQENKRRAT